MARRHVSDRTERDRCHCLRHRQLARVGNSPGARASSHDRRTVRLVRVCSACIRCLWDFESGLGDFDTCPSCLEKCLLQVGLARLLGARRLDRFRAPLKRTLQTQTPAWRAPGEQRTVKGLVRVLRKIRDIRRYRCSSKPLKTKKHGTPRNPVKHFYFRRRPRGDGGTSRCWRRIAASIPKHCVAALRRDSISRLDVRAAFQPWANLSAARTAARCTITISGSVSNVLFSNPLVDPPCFFGFSAVTRLVLIARDRPCHSILPSSGRK